MRSFLQCVLLAISLAGGWANGGPPVWLRDTASIGLPSGETAPGFDLPDQNGHRRTLASVMGPRGLVLVFFRSADW